MGIQVSNPRVCMHQMCATLDNAPASSMGRLLSLTEPKGSAPAGVSGDDSSSPVDSTAAVGTLWTHTLAAPTLARMPVSAAQMRSPARSTTCARHAHNQDVSPQALAGLDPLWVKLRVSDAPARAPRRCRFASRPRPAPWRAPRCARAAARRRRR